MLKSDQWLWGFRSEVSRWCGWRPTHLASSRPPRISMKGLLGNTLPLECRLDTHAQLGLGKPQLLLGAPGKGVGWGREVEAERGPEMFSCSRVCCEETHLRLTGLEPKSWLYPLITGWATMCKSPHLLSLWGFIPISTSNTCGNFPRSRTLFWVLEAQQWRRESPASWSLHSAWWWAFLSLAWNKDASLSNLPHGIVLKCKRDTWLTHSSWCPSPEMILQSRYSVIQWIFGCLQMARIAVLRGPSVPSSAEQKGTWYTWST